jgi:hypothetical protein
MPVPSDITALSTTAASNSPVGSETPSSIDDYLRSHASFIAQLRAVIGGAVNPNIPTNLGTAATANLTTSALDTTAGRVLKVGDFGLGATHDYVPNIDSSIIPTGFYYYGDLTAGIKPSAYGTVTITVAAWGAWVMQQAHTTSNTILTRSNINNTGWTAWVEVATTANSLGQGQTWQNVTASRAHSTGYTNSTGRPIQVNITIGPIVGQTAYNMVLLVGGVNAAQASDINGGEGESTSTLSAIVPNGAGYILFLSTGGIKHWAELR